MKSLGGRSIPSLWGLPTLSHLSHHSRRNSTSTCLLCDTSFQDWHSHSASVAHRARHIVCSNYVNPERHDTMLKELWRHINLDLNQVDEISAKKDERRRGRLTSSLKYLVQRGTVKHSLIQLDTRSSDDPAVSGSPPPRADASPLLFVDSRFSVLASIGWTFAEREVLERVSRLMPEIDGHSAMTVAHHCLSPRQTSGLFYLLRVGEVLTFPVSLLRNDDRSAMLFALLGELQLASRNRGTNRSVADRGAAEALVLNILGSHLVDSMISELVHGVLQKVVDEGAPVWREYRQQHRLLQAGMTTKTLTSAASATLLSLTARPIPSSSLPSSAPPQISDDLLQLHSLSSSPTEEIFPPHADVSIADYSRASLVDIVLGVDEGSRITSGAVASGSSASGGSNRSSSGTAAPAAAAGGAKSGVAAMCLPKLQPINIKKR